MSPRDESSRQAARLRFSRRGACARRRNEHGARSIAGFASAAGICAAAACTPHLRPRAVRDADRPESSRCPDNPKYRQSLSGFCCCARIACTTLRRQDYARRRRVRWMARRASRDNACGYQQVFFLIHEKMEKSAGRHHLNATTVHRAIREARAERRSRARDRSLFHARDRHGCRLANNANADSGTARCRVFADRRVLLRPAAHE